MGEVHQLTCFFACFFACNSPISRQGSSLLTSAPLQRIGLLLFFSFLFFSSHFISSQFNSIIAPSSSSSSQRVCVSVRVRAHCTASCLFRRQTPDALLFPTSFCMGKKPHFSSPVPSLTPTHITFLFDEFLSSKGKHSKTGKQDRNVVLEIFLLTMLMLATLARDGSASVEHS